MITEKPWGTTERVLQTPFVEAHRIAVNPFSRCSWHCHERKWNAFVLVAGELSIEHETGELIGHVNLRSRIGNFYAVRPGEYHRFVTGAEPATAIELYYPDTLSEDIIRRDVGGNTKGSKRMRDIPGRIAERHSIPEDVRQHEISITCWCNPQPSGHDPHLYIHTSSDRDKEDIDVKEQS